MNEGFIKVFRKMTDWEWYKDSNVLSVFIHILLLANWEDKKWRNKIIKRGSFITSVEHLAIDSGLSIQETRTVLTKLIETGEINKRTTNKYTLIIVNNYNEYQEKQQTNNKQSTTTKEYKEVKNKDINNIKKNTKKNLIDLSGLYSISDEYMESLSNKYQVPIAFVLSKYDDLKNWVEEKPDNPKLKGRVWNLTLANWVKRDMLQIKTDYAKQNNDLSL